MAFHFINEVENGEAENMDLASMLSSFLRKFYWFSMVRESWQKSVFDII